MIYHSFAQLYDELFDPAMYQQWLDFVQRYVAPSPDETLLDLAGGSGRLAVLLAQAGYQVSDFDLSADMLALAAQHAKEAGVTIPLIEGNMLNLSDLGRYDTITCFADSLCYLTDAGEVRQVFAQVLEHLVPHGRFIFDVITPKQTDDIYPGYMYHYLDDDQAFLWTSYAMTEPNHAVEHELTFFTANEATGDYQRVAEHHYERTYPLATYQKLLATAGFTVISVTGDFGAHQATENDTRWFFVCEREG